MPAAPSPDRRRLRVRLKALCWSALEQFPEPPAKAARAQATDGATVIRLTIAKAGQLPGSAERAGLFLSPIEEAVCIALESGPLPAKQIARRVGQKYTPTFRGTLFNLVNRKVLVKAKGGQGYALPGGDTKSPVVSPLK